MSQKRKYCMIGIVSICVCFMIGFLVYEVFFANSNGKITFTQENIVIEYGSDTASETLVASVEGNIINYPSIDTMTLGEQELVYTVDNEGKTSKVTKDIEVMDTQAATIQFHQEKVQIKKGSEIHPTAYIKLVQDPVDGVLKQAERGDAKNTYWIEHDVDINTIGTYSMKVYAVDKNGLRSDASLPIEVVEEVQATSGNGNQITKPTYIKDILLVNKTYGLPSDFGGLDESASSALFELQAGASVAGFDMPMLSGYRSYEYQVNLYNQYVARDGQEAADRYSARPGYSEHQTGLCFDVGAIDNDYGETPAGQWLAAHAADYGFILRFPEGKESITGYMYEPWHIRYVGKTDAQAIYKAGVTLEEYLGVDK